MALNSFNSPFVAWCIEMGLKTVLPNGKNLYSLWEGETLNLGDKIGSGQFGAVYRVEAPDVFGKKTKSTYILKEFLASADTVTVEALTLMVISDPGLSYDYRFLKTVPNLVQVFGLYEGLDRSFVVMENMTGGSLEDLMEKGKKLTVDQALNVLIAISEPLTVLSNYSDASGKRIAFVHRDLFTRNIMINVKDNEISAKLGDFGLFRELIDGVYKATKSSDLGPVVVAPEVRQSEDVRVFTTASEVWGFGVLIWQVFAANEDPNDYWDPQRHKFGGTKPAKCPPQVWEIAESCLNADPKKRPTFADVQAKLQAARKVVDGSVNVFA